MLISTLWLFAILNYLYCDIFGLMDANVLSQFLDGTINGIEVSPVFLLGASVLMEIPIAMVLLSRILPVKTNKRVNLGAGMIMTVVQLATLFVGSFTVYYLLFSIIEITTTATIVRIAWYWKADSVRTELPQVV